LVWDDGLLKGFVIHNSCRDEDALVAHEIQALYVEPAFVREGVGSALLRAAEWAGTDLGRSECKLWVLEANAKGRAFYEKNGYEPDGGVKVIEEWDGARELRYAKSLGG
jgi:GNAT superfamily N-acetyltransferase